MEFDKSKVFTMLNADELRVGSEIIGADNLACLKYYVEEDIQTDILREVKGDECQYRFITEDGKGYVLAYLVAEPEGLKWTELKIGDVIRNKNSGAEFMVVGVSKDENAMAHICIQEYWISDESLLCDWEKVEK